MSKKQELIDAAKDMLKNYSGQVTVRQLYYRLVAAHVIPNHEKEYKRLIKALSDARVKTAEIPFGAFEDKTRSFDGTRNTDRSVWDALSRFEHARETFENAEESFKKTGDYVTVPKWHGQDYYVEVWCEKDALTNVFSPACGELNVAYGASKGQASLSWLYEAALRLKRQVDKGRKVVILVYTDFDPAGIDIFRNIQNHLYNTFGIHCYVTRRGLTKDQMIEYDVPPMMTKKSDSRSAKWIAEHGDISCAELDAIEPEELKKIIKRDVLEYWSKTAAKKRRELREEIKSDLKDLVAQYVEEKL